MPNHTTINLESLLDLSATLNASPDETAIINAAMLSMMGKLRTLRIACYEAGTEHWFLYAFKGKQPEEEFPAGDTENSFQCIAEEAGYSLSVPIRVNDTVRFILFIGKNIVGTFYDETERHYISLVCTITSNALRMLESTRSIIAEKAAVESRNQLLQTLFEMSNELGNVFTREQILQTFSLRLMGQLMVNRFAVAVRNQDNSFELIANRFHADISGTQLEQLHELQKTTFTSSIRNHHNRAFCDANGIELITPLLVKNEVRGVLAVGRKLVGNYSEYDIRFIEAMSSTLITALENARLFEQEVEKKRMEGELNVARDIQRKLLPETIPQFPTHQIAAANISSRHVGGDYYDAIKIGDDKVILAIADVSGKGMPASLLMANIQAALRVVAPLKLPLPDTVARLNDIVYANTTADKFVTFFGAEIQFSTNEFRYVNAGHNPPYLLRAGTDTIEELHDGGIILGIMETMIPYRQGMVKLQSGDVVVMYTDGVSEAMNVFDVEYGEERLKRVILDSRTLSVEGIVQALVDDVKSHAGTAPQSDDITILVVRAL